MNRPDRGDVPSKGTDNMMLKGFLLAFTGSALLTGAVCLSSNVLAANAAFSEWSCRRLTTPQLVCGFTDTRPGLEHISVNAINVHGHVNSGSGLFASACVTFFDTLGSTCGPTVSVSGTGLKFVQLVGSNLNVWKDANNQFDFPWVAVCSASSCTSGAISLQGIFFTT